MFIRCWIWIYAPFYPLSRIPECIMFVQLLRLPQVEPQHRRTAYERKKKKHWTRRIELEWQIFRLRFGFDDDDVLKIDLICAPCILCMHRYEWVSCRYFGDGDHIQRQPNGKQQRMSKISLAFDEHIKIIWFSIWIKWNLMLCEDNMYTLLWNCASMYRKFDACIQRIATSIDKKKNNWKWWLEYIFEPLFSIVLFLYSFEQSFLLTFEYQFTTWIIEDFIRLKSIQYVPASIGVRGGGGGWASRQIFGLCIVGSRSMKYVESWPNLLDANLYFASDDDQKFTLHTTKKATAVIKKWQQTNDWQFDITKHKMDHLEMGVR